MHIVSGYIGSFTFFVWGGWGQPSHSENMGPEDILNGESCNCSTQKRGSQTLCHSEWTLRLTRKHTWIFIHLLSYWRMSLPEPLDLINLEFGQPSSPAHGMSQPSQTVTRRQFIPEKEILNEKKKKSETSVSSTARDFQIDSHVTSLVTWGTKLVMKQPPPYCH